MEPTSEERQVWFPLESNPQNINEYIQRLGFQTSSYEFCDVLSTEDWALDLVPQSVAAVLFLCPQKKEHDACENVVHDDNVWFMKQTIGNACGTMGLLHTLLNLPQGIRVYEKDSALSELDKDCPKSLFPLAKAKHLERDTRIAKLHEEATASATNATDRGLLGATVDPHYIALVHVDNKLYGLDGDKEGPVLHGTTTPANLLRDSINVIQNYMTRDPNETRFAITALAPTIG